MAYADFDIVYGLRRLVSNLTSFWRNASTRRHVNELPEHILKDIGWPDAYAEQSTGDSRNGHAGRACVKTLRHRTQSRMAAF
jgi:uncharacterized protein YjiS (DUF1127 family)